MSQEEYSSKEQEPVIENIVGQTSSDNTDDGSEMSLVEVSKIIEELQGEIRKIFVGHDELVTGTLSALFAGGHALIEGVPGLGKTLLVRVLGQALGCKFSRIQFTPDLMPTDITGTHVFDQEKQKFVFYPGPIFANIVLADEINRSPPKTHSALLEVMQEKQVSIDGKRFRTGSPFLVLATQNPVEYEGTYNLPEASVDRFLLKLVIDYPVREQEVDIFKLHRSGQADQVNLVRSVLSPEKVISIMKAVEGIHVSDALIDYITELVRTTRNRAEVQLGCSPRAGIALIKCSRVQAVLDGRDYVVADDVKKVIHMAFRHRISLTPEAELEGFTSDSIVDHLLETIPVPEGVQ